jgi:NAD(P)-dependent dehydrogenase (short-subunit alcohol dehydrogenase family)
MHIPGLSAYAATKVALNMLSDTARVELAPDNIRVISVLPRMTATRFRENSLGSSELRRQQRANPNVPVDSPEYVAEKILCAAIKEPEEQYMDG